MQCPFWERELGPHLTQCGRGRGLCLHAKFHFDSRNRLATIHQRYSRDRTGQIDRQTDRQTDRRDNGPIAYSKPLYKRSPKNRSPCAISDRFLVCLSVLSLTVMYCGQTVGLITNQDATWYGGIGLGPGYIVLDRDPASLTERGTALRDSSPPRFPVLLTVKVRQSSLWVTTADLSTARPRPYTSFYGLYVVTLALDCFVSEIIAGFCTVSQICHFVHTH